MNILVKKAWMQIQRSEIMGISYWHLANLHHGLKLSRLERGKVLS